jgi:hypothetical protein
MGTRFDGEYYACAAVDVRCVIGSHCSCRRQRLDAGGRGMAGGAGSLALPTDRRQPHYDLDIVCGECGQQGRRRWPCAWFRGVPAALCFVVREATNKRYASPRLAESAATLCRLRGPVDGSADKHPTRRTVLSRAGRRSCTRARRGTAAHLDSAVVQSLFEGARFARRSRAISRCVPAVGRCVSAGDARAPRIHGPARWTSVQEGSSVELFRPRSAHLTRDLPPSSTHRVGPVASFCERAACAATASSVGQTHGHTGRRQSSFAAHVCR